MAKRNTVHKNKSNDKVRFLKKTIKRTIKTHTAPNPIIPDHFS